MDVITPETLLTPHLSGPAAAFFASLATIPWTIWSLYLVGMLMLLIGGYTVVHREFAVIHGLDTLVALGPVLLAGAVAVFGAEHFVFMSVVAGMVPGWIPGHTFWALFVGVCLILAGLSISTQRYAAVAALMLGLMICLFVVLIHIPGIVSSHGKRLLWVVGLRDLAFAGGALAVAALYTEDWTDSFKQKLVLTARLFIGVPILFLGVQQFLHPELAPGVPLDQGMPLWLPGHLFWAFIIGAIYVVAGICLVINQQARVASAWLGLTILLVALIVYLPSVVANPANVGVGFNSLEDVLLLSGSVLAFAGAANWEFSNRANLRADRAIAA
jgi:uncharacterized membrane protein YphA (DoxX/SURF4 family)